MFTWQRAQLERFAHSTAPAALRLRTPESDPICAAGSVQAPNHADPHEGNRDARLRAANRAPPPPESPSWRRRWWCHGMRLVLCACVCVVWGGEHSPTPANGCDIYARSAWTWVCKMFTNARKHTDGAGGGGIGHSVCHARCCQAVQKSRHDADFERSQNLSSATLERSRCKLRLRYFLLAGVWGYDRHRFGGARRGRVQCGVRPNHGIREKSVLMTILRAYY